MGIDKVKDMDKYNEFRGEAERSIRKLDKLKKELAEINRLVDAAYMGESEISKGLSANDRSYKKLVWQIKEKKLEIRAMELESSIEGVEEYLHLQILYLARMEDRIEPLNFSYQLRDTKMTKSIKDNYANMNMILEENELCTMQMRLLAMQASRGEISDEDRITEQANLKEKIEDNKDYVEILKEDLVKERTKQLEHQIFFKFKQGQISADKRDQLLSEIHKMDSYSQSYTLEDMFNDSSDNVDARSMGNPKK